MGSHSTENLFARRMPDLAPSGRRSARRKRPHLSLGVCLAAGALLLLLASCSESQRLVVAADGSGSAEVEVRLSPMLVSYLHDLMASMESEGTRGGSTTAAPPIFDLPRVRSAFERLPGVSGVEAHSPSDGSLSLRFAFRSLSELLQGPQAGGGRNPMALTTVDGATTIRFHLDRENLIALTSLPPLRDNPLLLALIPKEGSQVTEAQELDLLEYAFGDYAPADSSVAAVVRASAIRVSLTVEGRILAQQGGTQEGNTVVFTAPLLRILALERPLDYSVTFR